MQKKRKEEGGREKKKRREGMGGEEGGRERGREGGREQGWREGGIWSRRRGRRYLSDISDPSVDIAFSFPQESLAKEGRKERRLSRSHLSDNRHELALLYLEAYPLKTPCIKVSVFRMIP